jgi:hypothetical protein
MRALLPPTSGDFSHPHLSRLAHTRAALNCDLNVGNIVPGAFTPVLAKDSTSFSLEDALSFGVDRMQGNFDPMRQQLEHLRMQQLSGEMARLTIYRAFIEANFKRRNTWREGCTTYISIRCTRNSHRAPWGALQTQLVRPSKSGRAGSESIGQVARSPRSGERTGDRHSLEKREDYFCLALTVRQTGLALSSPLLPAPSSTPASPSAAARSASSSRLREPPSTRGADRPLQRRACLEAQR